MTISRDRWTLEVFVTDNGREPFTAFADNLSDTAFSALDAALSHVLAARGIGLASTEWLKPLGHGLHEFRIRHTAEEITHMFAGEPPASVPRPGVSILRGYLCTSTDGEWHCCSPATTSRTTPPRSGKSGR
jgi:hypothetical protein